MEGGLCEVGSGVGGSGGLGGGRRGREGEREEGRTDKANFV